MLGSDLVKESVQIAIGRHVGLMCGEFPSIVASFQLIDELIYRGFVRGVRQRERSTVYEQIASTCSSNTVKEVSIDRKADESPYPPDAPVTRASRPEISLSNGMIGFGYMVPLWMLCQTQHSVIRLGPIGISRQAKMLWKRKARRECTSVTLRGWSSGFGTIWAEFVELVKESRTEQTLKTSQT